MYVVKGLGTTIRYGDGELITHNTSLERTRDR
jgi:hypothetical protein